MRGQNRLSEPRARVGGELAPRLAHGTEAEVLRHVVGEQLAGDLPDEFRKEVGPIPPFVRTVVDKRFRLLPVTYRYIATGRARAAALLSLTPPRSLRKFCKEAPPPRSSSSLQICGHWRDQHGPGAATGDLSSNTGVSK